MTEKNQQIKVAVVQAAPVLFNREATLEKACGLIEQAAEQASDLEAAQNDFIGFDDLRRRSFRGDAPSKRWKPSVATVSPLACWLDWNRC